MGIGNAYFALENFAKAKDNYLMALEIGDPDEDLYYMLDKYVNAWQTIPKHFAISKN